MNQRQNLPYRHHIGVHALELFLRGLEGVRGRVEFVGFEALIRERDLERLVIFLESHINISWSPSTRSAELFLLRAHVLSRREMRRHR